ncbi:MAG: PEGA domain-containing protein [Gammaproteobacteria bacterium]|nr:PEGA domain-containing protein [Gammaproteobacteria bacterium]
MHKFLPVAILVLLSTGCATMFRGTEQSVSINTTPNGAKVMFSDGRSCISPCNLSVKRKDTVGITIEKKGYHTHTTSLVPTLSGSGVLLGGIVDYGTGAVYDLQPNPLHVHLISENKS